MAVDEHNMEVGVLCITISQGSQRRQHIFLSAYIEIIYTYFSSLSVTGILLEKKIQNIYYVYEKISGTEFSRADKKKLFNLTNQFFDILY